MALSNGLKYYEILDIPSSATDEQIRAAYRILVQLHHPDRLQQVSPAVRTYAEERLKKINEAYGVLGDPDRRALYDATQRRSPRQAGDYAAAYDEPTPASARRARSRRPPTAEQAEAQAAYEEWAHQEAERYAATRESERARRAQEEFRAAEARARRAAEEQFPRARLQGSELVLHFAPGVWTPMVHVQTGAFLMGSDPAADPEASRAEQPQHQVRLSEYYIGKYPITNAQFAAFARATQRAFTAAPPNQDNFPVVNVAWDDAAALCQWLSQVTSRSFRLPTEAEWEKAARGAEGWRYAWGNDWDPARLNADSRYGGPTPVGRFSPLGDSPYGAADMSGNVWEWCADWFDARLYARRGALANDTRAWVAQHHVEKHLVNDPPGPSTGQGYVVRGGAFDSSPRHTRCAHRNWYYPDAVRPDLGFRIVALPR
jgi:formylglycine-generating enzyme required for sulfatase activity